LIDVRISDLAHLAFGSRAVSTLISDLEFCFSSFFRHSFHSQRLSQIFSKWRREWRRTRYNRRLEFFRDARRQVDLAATPGRMHDCVSQRSQRQWIQHRTHLRQHLRVWTADTSRINHLRKILKWHNSHRARDV
jgi:hypothetical protein